MAIALFASGLTNTIWAASGRVIERGRDAEGRPLYELGLAASRGKVDVTAAAIQCVALHMRACQIETCQCHTLAQTAAGQ